MKTEKIPKTNLERVIRDGTPLSDYGLDANGHSSIHLKISLDTLEKVIGEIPMAWVEKHSASVIIKYEESYFLVYTTNQVPKIRFMGPGEDYYEPTHQFINTLIQLSEEL